MLEFVSDGPVLTDEEIAERIPALRVDLVNAQFDLRTADFSVLVLVGGDDRLGANDAVQRMHEWMDARHIDTNIFRAPSADELARPRFWRYWRVLPPHGRIGVYLGAWAIVAVGQRARGVLDEAGFELRIKHIRQFERQLADDGTLVLKYWVHLPREKLQERMEKALADENYAWQLEEVDWQWYDIYDECLPHIDRLLTATNETDRPWHVLDSSNSALRDYTFARTLLDALQERLASPPSPKPVAKAVQKTYPDLLGQVDLGQAIPKNEYVELLAEYQVRLTKLTRRARQAGQSTVLVFEGWDAAGKGGAIRRLIQPMALIDYRVAQIAAPTDEERSRHYLWRFWRLLPEPGQIQIFDRSWYGRVLVERVEGFATPGEWQRAYREIRDFELQLAERGIIVEKFWLHIDADEQLRRFEARQQTAYKKYKITEEDYRNRQRWPEYAAAVNELVARTSRDHARWHLVAANDKRHARIEVLRVVCDALERALQDA